MRGSSTSPESSRDKTRSTVRGGITTGERKAARFGTRIGDRIRLGDYDDVFPRFAGALTLGLGVLVIQTVRHRIAVLYPALIWVRVFFCACYLALFLQTRDPFFLAMLGLVGSGAILTAIAYLRDR